MRAVVQRVSSASVCVEGERVGSIDQGLLVLLGVSGKDTAADAEWLVEKIVNLRVFEDEERKLNRSLLDVGGKLLVVSQFTLYGNCRKGRRPSFVEAAPPEVADALYNVFVTKAKERNIPVQTGVFQAHMMVELVNDGPVTLIIDTPEGA
ncbi:MULTISPECIES: D-aminoacyl-tRNA deacylase [Aminobacterium]|jgi:D-tyrosyl-tRNA(Tyr) deacylase|uniref:D-aminoacyl-tRNA deacylase n=1 Tax=Aminobacterium colombiense (strain DSM 12261 / ALA-1) TaxID=572547 RepID=D5EDV1_AMICL|nr:MULTISPECIES: D-aminoacyl-tRNA deacylase [Aminobacterium]MDD2379036.1 D-aminoacyl-tRNA deacylase [Aminobacterium colombiense]ADE56733.1 D-tyrosyl-tRNA(Tyr) deacylase [Aminobacterium colombiense DSM 12261]MDD3767297.1 D-aminoacyl-tRNA deacylase [Aminobacterium colombiense]MDD4265326.1 D-aminoacyl-tRNA deacylase [Aminobacterium colombiense]MDD4586036.1 D-aminoacyl-tRNA deacylase [Aminobacterium colombiense]